MQWQFTGTGKEVPVPIHKVSFLQGGQDTDGGQLGWRSAELLMFVATSSYPWGWEPCLPHSSFPQFRVVERAFLSWSHITLSREAAFCRGHWLRELEAGLGGG